MDGEGLTPPMVIFALFRSISRLFLVDFTPFLPNFLKFFTKLFTSGTHFLSKYFPFPLHFVVSLCKEMEVEGREIDP